MLENMSVKNKLITLIVVSLLALAALGGATFHALTSNKVDMEEIGVVRLPSVVGLYQMKVSGADVRLTALSAAVFENNYHAQDKFSALLKKRQEIWAGYEKGLKIYEPLPQTDEEAIAWKQFVKEIGDYRQAEARTAAIIEQLSRNTDPKAQQTLFVEYFKSRDIAGPLFGTAMQTLDKIIELNIRYGDETVKHSMEYGLLPSTSSAR